MDENYSGLVDIAYKMHVAGKLEDAKLIYEKLLSINPEDLNLKNLYAQLNVALGNYDIALELFVDIYEKTKINDIQLNIAQVYIYKKMYSDAVLILNSLNKNNTVLRLLSSCYMNLQDYDSAIKVFQELIKLDSSSFLSYYNLSLCFKFINNIDDSLKYALKAFDINTTDTDLLLHISYLYEKLEDYNNSIIYLEKIIDIKLDENVFYQLGVLHKKIEEYKKAVYYFDKVIQINPNNKNAMLNIAATYKNINMAESLAIYDNIQKIYPDDLQVPFYKYNIYFDMLNFDEALKIALDLIKIKPDDTIYYVMAASCYNELFEYETAIKYLLQALTIEPDNDSIKINLASAYYGNANYDEAEKIINSVSTKDDISLFINLRKRDLEKDIDSYIEYSTRVEKEKMLRHKAKKFFYKLNIDDKYNVDEETFVSLGSNSFSTDTQNMLQFSKKLLKLSDNYQNKNILYYTLHGVGDFFMFIRYLHYIKEKANNILLYIPKSLKRLVEYNFPNAKLFYSKQTIPENLYDFSMTEMQSICFSGTNLRNIPFSNGYISIQDELIEEKSKLDILKTSAKKIGIFWQGNPTVLLNRSLKLEYFLPLLDIDNTQFYSFQISDIDTDSSKLLKEQPIIDLAPLITDYADTAAFLKNLDLLITIDTSIANLAGAMGIKTFLLLPYDSEWRWFLDDKTTPWYDSVRIFKQTKPKDWDEVIKRVKDELQL